ncbi:MAG TPA: hypothetical protein VGM75_16325 [Pseudonocardiaceae bacterium]
MRPTRRGLEIALGVLWLVDGALQFQPFMFTKDFFAGILGMASMGLPGPVTTVNLGIGDLLIAHPALFNAIFATLQVALGLGLLWPRTANIARGVSIPWALGVWMIGEGFGALGMDGTGLLTGAPGAALLYAVLALALWPSTPLSPGEAVADGGAVQRGRWVRYVWAVVWIGIALLEFEPLNHAAGVPSAQLANIGQGEPGWVAALNSAVGGIFAGAGLVFAVVVGLLAVFVGLGVFDHRTHRVALLVGIALAVFSGIFGQDLGGLLTGQATDPGTGAPLVLFALSLWPVTARIAIPDSRQKESAVSPIGLSI